MKNIDNIINRELLEFVNKKFNGKAVLTGRRALALAGITFKRPFTNQSDHDFAIKELPMKYKLPNFFLTKAGGIDSAGYKKTDTEEVEGIEHYYFNHLQQVTTMATGSFADVETYTEKSRNCLFVNPNTRIIEVEGIKISHPEDILKYKKEYVNVSEKHKIDMKNINMLRYKLKDL